MQITAPPLPLQPARGNTPTSVDQAARQLESQFAQLLVKSMRSASFGNTLFPAENSVFHDMYDQQLAQTLSQGQGLGLAPLIARQLGTQPAVPMPSPTHSTTKPAPVSVVAKHQHHAAVKDTATQEGFIRRIWPQAQQAARELGVDPRAIAAQAALETGWGQHLPRQANGRSSHNLFGIKARGTPNLHWQGTQATAMTTEFNQGQRHQEQAAFRTYDTLQHSFADYVRLLKSSPRYQAALKAGHNIRAFAQGLQQGGYATDPEYAAKITAIASSPAVHRVAAAATGTAFAPAEVAAWSR